MRVLLLGAGGRESALARAFSDSPSLEALFTAPGNPGTAALGRNLSIDPGDVAEVVAAAKAERIDLVVVGPEAPLAFGVADALVAAGIACFGPSAAAARIESSKAFSKALMQRHGIPTAAARIFTDPVAAAVWALGLPRLPVVKASGLSAGKGVILPESREELVGAIDRLLALGGQGAEILVEERLEGEELSLLAVCDGHNWVLLPPARDHKRLLEGDRGPNTGGMGSYAPAASMEVAEALAGIVIAPVISALAAEGNPFVGVLFAGLMLTPGGPRVLEYNCRFGDPETQAILPLYDGDLLELLDLATRGRLSEARPRWKDEAVACIVLAAEGYPEAPIHGRAIGFPASLPLESSILPAGMGIEGQRVVSTGGRVLNALGRGRTLEEAVARARDTAGSIRLEGALWRRDIGSRGSLDEVVRASLASHRGTVRADSAYSDSGVDIDAGNRAVELMKAAVRSTYGSEVLAGIGAFGGLYDAGALKAMEKPVLVASTDGVGTKTSLGVSLGRVRGLGIDMVNHSIDDILVQGARPLFFLDYVAASRLVPETVAEIVAGMAEACREAGCALLGGETAEMPGTYREGELDIAGTIVGVVEGRLALPRGGLAAGDLLVGLASSGLHTNGYSLARRVLGGLDLLAIHPALGESLADALLRPHRSYLGLLAPSLEAAALPVKALAHITGGGFVENIPRILPPGLDAVIRWGSWKIPPLFSLIQARGSVSDAEMARVFNLGIGMVAVVAPSELDHFRSLLPEPATVIGELVPGSGRTLVS